MHALRVSHYAYAVTGSQEERHILTADTNKASRIASARAFVHSLNILVKYVRLYGLSTNAPRDSSTSPGDELQQGLPTGGDGGFLLGVSDNRLLLDGIPLETGQAERSFAQLLTTAGLASIQFSQQVTKEDFIRLVRSLHFRRIESARRCQADQRIVRR